MKPATSAGNGPRCAISVHARDKLLVFMTRRDVEPANNASEHALRMPVIFRRDTNGLRSLWGAKAYAGQRSIVATRFLRGRRPLASLRAALA